MWTEADIDDFSSGVFLVDFCGTYGYGLRANFWAWWDGHEKVQFGGDWYGIPSLLATEPPSVDEIYQWVTAMTPTTHDPEEDEG